MLIPWIFAAGQAIVTAMMATPNPTVLEQLHAMKIVPAVVLDDPEQARPLADALVAGGLPTAEITFRTPAAEQAIRSLAHRTDLLLGAGTVMDVATAKRAIDAGAKYVVSPGFSPKVVQYCLDHGVTPLPGVATPTDITMALDMGVTAVKFFPAEALGGIATLKALAGPFPMIRFVPTGGIHAENLRDYLALPQTLACGGSWITPKKLIAAGQFDEITRIAREAVALSKSGN